MTRHRIANLLYRLAAALDRGSGRVALGGDMLTFGDDGRSDYREDRESITVQLHSREKTQVSADFKPGSYTYAALHLGPVTVFLRRQSTVALIAVLTQVESAYRKYGESKA